MKRCAGGPGLIFLSVFLSVSAKTRVDRDVPQTLGAGRVEFGGVKHECLFNMEVPRS